MKIVIPGGSGQVGTVLARSLHGQGHDVTVLSRRPHRRQPWQSVAWDGATIGKWTEVLEGADAVINLCGRSVNCRYTAANRRAIVDSRVDPTRLHARAIKKAANKSIGRPEIDQVAGHLTDGQENPEQLS